MVGKHQYYYYIAFFLIFLSFSIQHVMPRQLNQESKGMFLDSPYMVVRNLINVEGHKQKKNIIRKLEIDNYGPSPDGQGHKRGNTQLNN